MRFPKTIKCLGAKYTVSYHNLKNKKWGETDYKKQTIRLANGLKTRSVDDRRKTLFHEAMHVLNWEMDIGLKEEHIAKLEIGLYHLLKDNKIL